MIPLLCGKISLGEQVPSYIIAVAGVAIGGELIAAAGVDAAVFQVVASRVVVVILSIRAGQSGDGIIAVTTALAIEILYGDQATVVMTVAKRAPVGGISVNSPTALKLSCSLVPLGKRVILIEYTVHGTHNCPAGSGSRVKSGLDLLLYPTV